MPSELQIERILIDEPGDVRLLALKGYFILLGSYEDDDLESAVVVHADDHDLSNLSYPGVVLLELKNEYLESEHFLQIAEMAFKSISE